MPLSALFRVGSVYTRRRKGGQLQFGDWWGLTSYARRADWREVSKFPLEKRVVFCGLPGKGAKVLSRA